MLQLPDDIQRRVDRVTHARMMALTGLIVFADGDVESSGAGESWISGPDVPIQPEIANLEAGCLAGTQAADCSASGTEAVSPVGQMVDRPAEESLNDGSVDGIAPRCLLALES